MALDITKPTVGGSEDTWGTELNTLIDSFDASVMTDNFAENSASHSGLNFAYKAGRIRTEESVNNVSASTVLLTDASTNYIEVASNGTVSANTTGFTAGRFPLYTVVTAGGSFTSPGDVTDKRCYNTLVDAANKISGTTNQISVADDGDGTVTISTPQDIDTAADVEFNSLGLGLAPTFPLDVETKYLSDNFAKFGDVHPIYCVGSTINSVLTFNAYYNSGWKFGKGSSSDYAGGILFDENNGEMRILFSTTAGNAGGSIASFPSRFSLDLNGDLTGLNSVDSVSYKVGGTSGASGTGTTISSITVTNGIVTAITVS